MKNKFDFFLNLQPICNCLTLTWPGPGNDKMVTGGKMLKLTKMLKMLKLTKMAQNLPFIPLIGRG